MSAGPFPCSGEAAAYDAGRSGTFLCVDCRLHKPDGEQRVYPHGNVCDACHEDRVDAGLDKEGFGSSPREGQQ